MKYPIALLIGAVLSAQFLHAATYTNSADADSFVRAAAPTLNYGNAGALSVSGSTATNTVGGTPSVADSFIRFNTAAMVSNFNTLYGSNNWVINGATLQVTETSSPGNSIFSRGIGAFQIRWLANDVWTEGTGTPGATTTNGIAYNNEASLLNSVIDTNLGVFTNTDLSQLENFSLGLPAVFVNDLRAGGEVTLFMTAIDANIGFSFNSRNFPTVSARPALNISAAARPVLASASVSGANVALSGANGVTNQTYLALASTNIASPLSQWTIISTNVLNVNGNFTITLTNAAGGPQRFFILQTK